MSLLSQMFTVLTMKIYFYLIGDEEITRYVGETIELKTEIDEVVYDCICQEVIFKATARKLFSSTRINRLYKVTMSIVGNNDKTHGTYPVLCPDGFVYTNYPHMLAIRCHYRLFYK